MAAIFMKITETVTKTLHFVGRQVMAYNQSYGWFGPAAAAAIYTEHIITYLHTNITIWHYSLDAPFTNSLQQI